MTNLLSQNLFVGWMKHLKDIQPDRPLQWLVAARQGYRACSQALKQTIELRAVILTFMTLFWECKQLCNRVLGECNSCIFEKWERKTVYRNLDKGHNFRSFLVNCFQYDVLTLLCVAERNEKCLLLLSTFFCLTEISCKWLIAILSLYLFVFFLTLSLFGSLFEWPILMNFEFSLLRLR